MGSDKVAFLAGGGELGALMREHDWTATSLGPPEGWPQSLKTAVRIMLTSRQPIWIGWGEDLLYLYNDPYKSIIGGKHPWALGRPTREVWQEIWAEIGPLLATAMQGDGTYVEEQLLIMERNGYPEETYYTFSYSPIPNDDGSAGGIICANSDDTQRVIGERQLTLLKELAARTADARGYAQACGRCAQALATNPRDLPFALLYLADGQNGHRLAAHSGIDTAGAGVPSCLEDGDAVWPLERAVQEHVPQPVDDLQARFPGTFTHGPLGTAPTRAVVFPVQASAEAGHAGALVVGLNPYRLFDEGYQGFLSLVAGQISTALANAEAYEEERRRAEALAAIDAAKTVFFSNVSHEFRTPLTLMLGPLEDLLAAPGRMAAQDVERLQLAHRNSLRLLRLVNTLLDFSRVEAGRMNAVFRPTDLGALTAELVSAFKEATQRAGLRLTVDVAGLGEPVYVDRGQWEKIVLNLLSNAFKFTFEGGIDVALHAVAGRARLVVADTGIGIEHAELPRLFERFHRVDGARGRSYEGSGIGLALVHELVRQHGGSITVESEPGQGSRFIVELPLGSAHLPAANLQDDDGPPGEGEAGGSGSMRARSFVEEAMRWLPAEQQPATAPGAPPAMASAGRSAEGGRILLADDNADLRMYIARLLAERGVVVDTVGDGAAALEAIRRDRPDLVISDVMMPRLDGFGLLQAIRGDAALRDIPVILLSARSGEEAQVEGLDAGADDYLTKPFSARELVARAESHMAMGRLRREATAALRESEGRFRNMADHAPVMMWVGDTDNRCTYLNRSWYEFTGQSPDAGLEYGWMQVVHPQDRERAEHALAHAHARRDAFRLEYRLRRHDGEYRWMLGAAAPRFGRGGEFLGHVGSILDIDDRRWQEAMHGLQSRMFELAIREGVFADTLAAIARLVEEHCEEGAAVSIMLADAAGTHLRHGAAPSLPPAFCEAIDGLAIAPGAGTCGAAAFSRAPVYAHDIATDPTLAEYHDLARRHGLGACWSTPILSGQDEILGVFAIYHARPRRAGTRDLELVELVSRTLLVLIERRRAQEALRDETRVLETLNRTGSALAAELDLERLVQRVTDAGVELAGARFGAFFYNVTDGTGESYMLYTLSGVDRSAFERFPMPRNTAVFAPTFNGEGTVRSDDITRDPRFGRNTPYHGMPEGHLPVRSYLAVPVVSRSGQVIGGLFFGHEAPGRFGDRHCRLLEGIAAQAAIAIDNARLYQDAQQEIARRRVVEEALQQLNEQLETRVAAEIGVRRQAEAALQQAQKMESIGQLTGGIAHDFNNLLQVISGNLQLLSKDIAGNPRAELRVQNALAGVSRGSRLASQMLAFGRRQPLEPKVINIGRLVRGLDDMLRRALGEEIEVETTISGGLWNTLADPGQVENALLNLAINARDAMGGRGRLTIEVGNAFLDDAYVRRHAEVRAGQYVMLAVTDTGCGIPADLLEKVFEPFFTTKPEGKGTGLGLSMVYGFARQSDGHVKVYSEVGHGTTIKLYLPRAHEHEDLLVPLDLQPVRGGNETVLVVEDDEDVRATAVEMLGDLGYRVLRAGDAASGLAIVESGIPIDLLFTDVVMPGPLRSPELARKARERIPGIAVLFTSGYTENAIVHGGRLDEGVSLLPKPYTRESLARKVRHVLANRQQQATAEAARAAPAPGDRSPAPVPPAVEPSRKGGGGEGGQVILLVEDDAMIRMVSAEMLQQLGHQVLEAGDAVEAAALLERHPVDLLLTDVELPGISGIELALQVRAARPHLALVFATGDEGRIERDRFPGAVVLRKPYDRAALVSCLARVGQGATGPD